MAKTNPSMGPLLADLGDVVAEAVDVSAPSVEARVSPLIRMDLAGRDLASLDADFLAWPPRSLPRLWGADTGRWPTALATIV